MNNYISSAKQLIKDKSFNYEYTYLKEVPNGYTFDDERNKKYGNSRKGYEIFKQNESFDISYSGEISLREIKDPKSKEVIGAILEKKISDNLWYPELEKIYNDAENEFMTQLNVKDKEAVLAYIDSTPLDFDFRTSATQTIVLKIERLASIIDDYKYDENFKKFFDKIKD